MAIVKDTKDLKNLRISGQILIQSLEAAAEAIEPGTTTSRLDEVAEAVTRENGGTPAFKGYQPNPSVYPFPGSLCVSINEQIVHGIPGQEKIYEGDIVSIDYGVIYEGMYTDCAITIPVGDIPQETRDLLDATYRGLKSGIGQAKAGNTTGDIGNAVENQAGKLAVVRDLIGHGVGHAVHEDPQVPNFGEPGMGAPLEEDLVIAIEPMFTMGTHRVSLASDQWMFYTQDESLSAHYEQTVRVTAKGAEVITPYSSKLKEYAGISD